MRSNNGNGIYIKLRIGLRESTILMKNCIKILMATIDRFSQIFDCKHVRDLFELQ